jgi:transcriptional regulator with XRE-family HTH domain
MSSFQITVSPSRRAAGRFVSHVRRAIQRALEEEHQKSGLTQSDIARAIGVHRSVINRELRGQKDFTLGRLAELAWALGRKPVFELIEEKLEKGANIAPTQLGKGFEAALTVAQQQTEFPAQIPLSAILSQTTASQNALSPRA